MTQEEKQLLLKDLCARLPYGVICVGVTYDLDDDGERYIPVKVRNTLTEIHNYTLETASVKLDLISSCKLETIKPYLRPMSSMTKEERKEYIRERDKDKSANMYHATYRSIDWLNKKMFDYRKDDEDKTMIEKGLALKAPEGMYNLKEK